jgi:hypothetical protein
MWLFENSFKVGNEGIQRDLYMFLFLRQVSALTLSSTYIVLFFYCGLSDFILFIRVVFICFLSTFSGPQKFPDNHRVPLNGLLFKQVLMYVQYMRNFKKLVLIFRY